MANNQLILEGILTEGDIIRAYMRRLAAKSGKSRSPKKVAACRRNVAKAREVKRQMAVARQLMGSEHYD